MINNKLFIDEKSKLLSSPPLFVLLAGVVGALVTVITSIKVLLYSTFIGDSILCCVVVLAMIFITHNLIIKIFYGGGRVSELTIQENSICLITMLGKVKTLKKTDIHLIMDGLDDWFYKRFNLILNDRKGLTIKLKNGKFFRISPHMERIDDLKLELEKIAEENK